jgi:UDP-N-acetylglucosamine 2-epimerase (non-hydrolysing)
MKIVSIVGARPQFIKAAELSKELRKKHKEILVHTGQHYDYDMSEVFFEELEIPKPDYNLGIGSGTHGWQTGEALKKIEEILLKEKPDIVLVYGDTNSTLAGSLAAAKLNIRLAHVEAGMRSFDRTMPEEINRVVSDHVSNVLLCSTKTAVRNLKKEGITKGVYFAGDIMIDLAKKAGEIADSKSKILEKLGLDRKKYLLATVHRAGNTDVKENLQAIVDSFIESGETIVFPVHPRTKKALEQYGLYEKLEKSKVKMIEPVSYVDAICLEKNAKKVLTDSGGVQKEAYFFRTPCITLRDTTEWVETVEAGWNVLVAADKHKIAYAIKNFTPTGKWRNFFGQGNAASNIRDALEG